MNKILKAIENGINEALNISSLSISDNEAHKDLELLNGYDIKLTDKKNIASKYGIESKKVAEIKQAIYEYLRKLRYEKTKFDKQDIIDFSRLFKDGEPARYNNVVEMYEQESSEFLKYLKKERANSILEIVKNNKRLNKFDNIEDAIKYFNELRPSDRNYFLSYRDIYQFQKYINVDRYLKENTDEFKNTFKVTEDNIQLIENKFTEEMKEFKEYKLNEVKENTSKFYDTLPSMISKFDRDILNNKDELNSLFLEWYDEQIDPIIKKYEDKNISYETANYFLISKFKKDVNNKNYRIIQSLIDLIDRKKSAISRYKVILRYSKDDFVSKEVKKAKEEFESRIKEVSKKMNDRGINGETVQIESVYNDPKCFEMLVHDQNQRLYARSIWAAEYSTLVAPHLRFIITNRPK